MAVTGSDCTVDIVKTIPFHNAWKRARWVVFSQNFIWMLAVGCLWWVWLSTRNHYPSRTGQQYHIIFLPLFSECFLFFDCLFWSIIYLFLSLLTFLSSRKVTYSFRAQIKVAPYRKVTCATFCDGAPNWSDRGDCCGSGGVDGWNFLRRTKIYSRRYRDAHQIK